MRCPSGIQPPNRARTRGWPALCWSSLDCPAAYIWLIRSYLADSLGKGDRVMVTGRLRQRSWETPEGERRSVTELKADDVGASLKVGHGQVERSAQRGNGDRT
jgi:hypothetical protein